MSHTESFTAKGYRWRLHVGPEAVEAALRSEAARTDARRAFVVTSPSIVRTTDLVGRAEHALSGRFAGVFDGIEVDSTYPSVRRAADAARYAGADLLVAIGGGSVIVATRAVNIFLSERADPFELMTQYPEGRPAHSPRLEAPKLPAVNIPTTPSTSANRAGTGLKNERLDHRMEYFDPKTRPAAIALDTGALASTPYAVTRSAATTVLAGAIGAASHEIINPLARVDREGALRLAISAYRALARDPHAVQPRIDLCLAAFLGNRGEDDGGRDRSVANAFTGDYALSTALHLRYPAVGQGEATAVLAKAVAYRSPAPGPAALERIAGELGTWDPRASIRANTTAAGDAIEALYRGAGMPTTVRELCIPRADIPLIARDTVKNFNSNSGVRTPEARIEESMALLDAAW